MKNNKGISVLIVIGLIVCYVSVVYLALNANLCLDYRFYLDKKVTDWPGYSGLKYQLEDTVFLGTKENGGKKIKHRGQGWSVAEDWGNWTTEENAHLYFIMEHVPDTDLKLIMKAFGFSPGERLIVDVFGNEAFLETLNIAHMTPHEYNIVIPRRIVSTGPLHLQFVIRNPSSPQQHGLSQDKRLLGLGVSWLKIVPQKKYIAGY